MKIFCPTNNDRMWPKYVENMTLLLSGVLTYILNMYDVTVTKNETVLIPLFCDCLERAYQYIYNSERIMFLGGIVIELCRFEKNIYPDFVTLFMQIYAN